MATYEQTEKLQKLENKNEMKIIFGNASSDKLGRVLTR